jgi:cytochrome c peroxidase
LYLYSLRPPPNPNRFDGVAATGKQIFERQRCGDCHTPPLYTNNELVPVDGFRPEGDSRNLDRADVMYARLGLDPRYTLQTRKGTGYYKVPSLKGLWYRGPLGHNGAVATLEDWLDPARQAVFPGHTFGLHLRREERQALIAFLKTL